MPAQRSDVGVWGCEIRVCQVRVPFEGVGKDSEGVVVVYVEGMIVAFVFGVELVGVLGGEGMLER
jgi:hypothetical protein